MSGTDLAHTAIGLRPCSAMAGTDLAYGATSPRDRPMPHYPALPGQSAMRLRLPAYPGQYHAYPDTGAGTERLVRRSAAGAALYRDSTNCSLLSRPVLPALSPYTLSGTDVD
eukprot:1004837-Rhodomonas_salina.2